MSLISCFEQNDILLMEGALAERLRRERHLSFDEDVALASLIYENAGREALAALWNGYIATARRHGLPFIATTPTRRANRERVLRSRFDGAIIEDNVAFLRALARESGIEMYVGGLMGCRGDAYSAQSALGPSDAKRFHAWQACLFAHAGADFLYAGIMPSLPEAIGMAQAMEGAGLTYIISFMIRRNGRLIDGTAIHDAITAIDRTVEKKPLCYMTNCVHPLVLLEALAQPFNQTETVRRRFLGIQANASALPPEALDGASGYESSPPEALADGMAALLRMHRLKIFGGCCGTDGRHMEAIAARLKREHARSH